MARFRTLTLGSLFTFAVAGILVAGGAVAAILTHSLQAIVAGGALVLASLYIGWRYWQRKAEVSKSHIGYIEKWDCNVFSKDAEVLKRWSPDKLDEISKIFDRVALLTGTKHADAMKGFNLSLLSNHFDFRGSTVSGINYQGVITVWWRAEDSAPESILSHELSHELLFAEGITGERVHHEEMAKRGYPW